MMKINFKLKSNGEGRTCSMLIKASGKALSANFIPEKTAYNNKKKYSQVQKRCQNAQKKRPTDQVLM